MNNETFELSDLEPKCEIKGGPSTPDVPVYKLVLDPRTTDTMAATNNQGRLIVGVDSAKL